MRLIDLQPKWLNEHIFVFRCPHCQKVWLSCKNAEAKISEQFDIFVDAGIAPLELIVPDKPDYNWTISGRDFASMSVSPSIDASASGHWHGSINNGECQ